MVNIFFYVKIRRNNNEFNEVWVVNVDPTKIFESVLVGKNAYWINGTEQPKESALFKMMNVSISRPDANFEWFGHATANTMNQTFSQTMGNNYNPLHWDSNSISITTSNYAKLNLWQKFMLTEWENSKKKTGLTGVGNMHYSPNSTSDYDWYNVTQTSVPSKWQEWENYPNLTNTPSKQNFSPVTAYINAPVEGTRSDARQHHRWWFGLFPHIDGYTADGYSNNWWNYFCTNEFVTSLDADTKTYTYKVGDFIDDIRVRTYFVSGNSQEITISHAQDNISLSNDSIISVESDGSYKAAAAGSTTLTYFRDGRSITLNIQIQ